MNRGRRDSRYTVRNSGTKKRYPKSSPLRRKITNNNFLTRRNKVLEEMSRRDNVAIKPNMPSFENWYKLHRKGLREFERGNYGNALKLRMTALATILSLTHMPVDSMPYKEPRFTKTLRHSHRHPLTRLAFSKGRRDPDELMTWRVDDLRYRDKIPRGNIRSTRRYGKKSKKKRVNTRKS